MFLYPILVLGDNCSDPGQRATAPAPGGAPRAAGGAAPEESLGGQAGEDLPDGDLIREAAVVGR